MKTHKVAIGARFSRLIVLQKVSSRRWLVRCDCGIEKIVQGGNLLNNTKSCGCLRRESNWRKDTSKVLIGQSTRNFKLLEYKIGAKNRNLTWQLTNEEFDKLTSSLCFYCGRAPNQIVKSKYKKGDFIYNGIDRVDNTKGYESSNVVSCCKICNRAKDTMTQKEFLAWIQKVYEFSHSGR